VRLHRAHAALLENPAPPATILAWSEQLLKQRPYSVAIQAEYVRSLAYAGRVDEARRLSRAMAAKNPASPIVRRLAAEI
jgi:hypothetical protein